MSEAEIEEVAIKSMLIDIIKIGFGGGMLSKGNQAEMRCEGMKDSEIKRLALKDWQKLLAKHGLSGAKESDLRYMGFDMEFEQGDDDLDEYFSLLE